MPTLPSFENILLGDLALEREVPVIAVCTITFSIAEKTVLLCMLGFSNITSVHQGIFVVWLFFFSPFLVRFTETDKKVLALLSLFAHTPCLDTVHNYDC